MPRAAVPILVLLGLSAVQLIVRGSDPAPAGPAGAGSGTQQVTGLEAVHRSGQTFLTWREGPAPALPASPTVEQVAELRRRLVEEEGIRYQVYRSALPIRSLDDAALIGEVPPLTGWNTDYYGIYPGPEVRAPRYVIEEGKPPVEPGTAIYAHGPAAAGEAYYAVTLVSRGEENRRITPQNSLSAPVAEGAGPGAPVLQRVERPDEFYYVGHPTLHYYVRWEAPPNSSAPSRPFDYLVAVPPEPAKPAPVGIHLHGWGGNLNDGWGWWYDADEGAVLVSSNQVPYDWWTGYHEFLGTARPLAGAEDWRQGVVRPYSQRRLLSFVDTIASAFDLDLSRLFAAGQSMGGSGSLMLAIRHPERIAWAVSWVGVHVPLDSPGFLDSYAAVFGEPAWAVRFEDGTPVWEHFDDVRYLTAHPDHDVGFLTFSNGKNDDGIGWSQAAAFHRALQQTRQPHVFVWGQEGHLTRSRMPVDGSEATMPLDLALDRSLPAFTRCSLDDDPGDGDPEDGAPSGQSNLYLLWETGDLRDEASRWEVTVGLADSAPAESCTVSLTPRRCQRFTVAPGERVRWTNTSRRGGRLLQSGEVVADRWGLVTIDGLQVEKGRNRIQLTPEG